MQQYYLIFMYNYFIQFFQKCIKKPVLFIFLSFTVFNSFAQKNDTVNIRPDNLMLQYLRTGKKAYVVYNKQSLNGAPEKIVLVNINVTSMPYKGKPAILIDQQWESDTIVHTASTVLNKQDLSTLQHYYFWKRQGYWTNFDFENKKVEFGKELPDSIRTKITAEFIASFEKYNLNWHSDLILFSVLPYKDNRTFNINFFDPGFGKMQNVFYTVIASVVLVGSSGEKADCWILQHTFTGGLTGYQKFWISKQTREVLKEEDSFNGAYRYKLKLAFGE